MSCQVEVIFTPAEYRALRDRELARSVCVVFDILRATSTMVTALANGAAGIIPVPEISEALAVRQKRPEVLLAGERNGVRIGASLTGGIEFDLGNSPRECVSAKVGHKTIVSTTTNGTRALRACAHASEVLAGSFLNLAATAEYLASRASTHILLICAGTGENTAWEDALAAGAMCELLEQRMPHIRLLDSAEIALNAYLQVKGSLSSAIGRSENAQRLLGMADLREDVAFCLQHNRFPLVATMDKNGVVVQSRSPESNR